MIFESFYWKKPLLQMVARFRNYMSLSNLTEKHFVQIERDVFIGFYSIRKLIEAITKLSDSAKEIRVTIKRYPNVRPVSWRNGHQITELFDFRKAMTEDKDILFVCNQIIHSFIFQVMVNEDGGLNGFYFASDKNKDNQLYAIDIICVIELFERIGSDEVNELHWRGDESGLEELELK